VQSLVQRVRELLEPVVEAAGYDLVAVEYITGSRRPLLRLSIDKPGGVSASDCSKVTREISPVLDVEDPIDSAFVLEVSSPGMERPLQRAQDFDSFKGSKVRLRLTEGYPRRRFSGVLMGMQDGRVGVEIGEDQHWFPFEDVQQARLSLTFDEFNALGQRAKEASDDQ